MIKQQRREEHQIIHDMIFGDGVLQREHWVDAIPQHATAPTGVVPGYWGYRLAGRNPLDPDAASVEVEVWASTIRETVERIAAGQYSEDGRGDVDPVGLGTVQACRAYLDDPEAGAELFTRDTADEVLQALVYGGIAFH